MAIRNPTEVAAACVDYPNADGMMLVRGEVVTADRLAIVARLREMARGPMATSMATTQDMFDIARILESEIRAAAASKGTNDDDHR